MISIPVDSIEKPITVVDYCAGVYRCESLAEVQAYGEACPEWVRQDERFTKAVAVKLADLRSKAAGTRSKRAAA